MGYQFKNRRKSTWQLNRIKSTVFPALGPAVRQSPYSTLLAAVGRHLPEFLPVVVLPSDSRWRPEAAAASSGPGARVSLQSAHLPPGPVPPSHAERPGAAALPPAPGGAAAGAAAAAAASPPPAPPALHLLANPRTRPQLVLAHRAVGGRP